jgi:hypothetical protein
VSVRKVSANGVRQCASFANVVVRCNSLHTNENFPLTQNIFQTNTVSIQIQKNSNSIDPAKLVLNQQKIYVLNAQRQNPSSDMVSKLIDHLVKK